MAKWCVFDVDSACGGCWRVIPAGAAVLEMRPHGQSPTGKQRRCVDCAARFGHQPDDQALDRERARLEATREREALQSETAAARTPTRWRARPLKTFKQLKDVALPFDAKAAAAGER